MTPPEIITFGCRLNAVESEIIRGHLDAAGPAADDLVVVHTCAVTAAAEQQARRTIGRLRRDRPGARIVVTGCAAQLDPAAWTAIPGVARVVGNAEKLRAESWLPGSAAAAADIMGSPAPIGVQAPRPANRTRAFLQIQQGCDHRCTFCIIPFARGPSQSLPMGAIVDRMRMMVAAGAQEIVLTGVDIASYGADLPGQPSLGDLARRALALVPDLPRLRLSSLDPACLDAPLWRLLAEEPRFMPHLHLSLQAGSDLVLKRMKRRHSRAGALAAIARARDLRPGLAIGADLIAGFPTETDALFVETLDFVAEAAIPYLHVFPYSARAGTPAARMPAVPLPLRRDRAARLRDAGRHQAAAFHAAQIGREASILAERGGAGHTEHFAPVRIAAPAGTLLRARITGMDDSGLLAEAA